MKLNLIIKALTALYVMNFCFFSGAEGLQENKEELVEMSETGESYWGTCNQSSNKCTELNLSQADYIIYGSGRVKIYFNSNTVYCKEENFYLGRHCLKPEEE